jgi:hypothetical protein
MLAAARSIFRIMSNSRRGKLKRQSGSKAARANRSGDGAFRMVVAAHPGSSVTVAPELGLVKAALIYGDKVSLLSPVTTMFLSVEALGQFSTSQQIQLLRRVAPYLQEPDQLPTFDEGLNQLDEFLRTTSRSRSLGDRLLRAGLEQQLQPIQQELSEAVRDLGKNAGIDQLALARSKGLVEIESANPGDAIDLLASCIIGAKLAETGERQDDPHSDQIVETFVGKLSQHLSLGREYLIFDERVASLTDAAIREGVFKPAKGPAGRSVQAMTASALMGRLPTFPDATVDEVLDIRTELAAPLTQFRSAMVTIAKGFASDAWESSFGDEVHDAWVETVHPAVEAIEASVQDNRSLFAMAVGVAGAANTGIPGLGIVAGGMPGHVDALTAFGGLVSVGAPVLQAFRDRQEVARQLRMQPFFFLYGVERSLG